MSQLISKHLKEVALIGTSKKQIDTALLPESVKEFITNHQFNDTEDEFLQALSINYFYAIAGEIPKKYTKEIKGTPIIETQKEAPPELYRVFQDIKLYDENINIKETMYHQYYDVLLKNNWIANKSAIPHLLDKLRNTTKPTQQKILQVIGELGRSVVKQIDEIEISQNSFVTNDSIWEEGTYKDRKDYLFNIRKEHSEKGILLLQSTWETESITHKLGFLLIIKETFVISDVDFLSKLLTSEFEYTNKERKTNKQCRSIITELLLRDPTSQLSKNTYKQLSKYIVPQKKSILKSLKNVVAKTEDFLQLPNQPDDFFNAEKMHQVYGFEEKNNDIAIYETDNHYWFSRLVASIPLKEWAKMFNTDIKKTIQFFLFSKQFSPVQKKQNKTQLYEVLKEQADNFKQIELVNALLELNKISDSNEILELLKLLDASNWESYMLNSNKLLDYVFLNTWNQNNGIWSKKFCDNWLRWIINNIDNEKLYDQHRIAEIASKYFSSDSLSTLEQYHKNKATDLQQVNFWTKHIYSPIHTVTTIKKELKNYYATR